MAKNPPKCLDNQSNQRASIYLHVISKHPKNPPQKSTQNKEATKVSAITDQLDDLNLNGCNTNINNFASLFDSYDYEDDKPSTKPKNNLFIVLI